MILDSLHGVIDRRILVNFRVKPEALEPLLPPPFQPQLVDGFGVAGICLIRLTGMRVGAMPRWTGLASENAAHRVAVRWTERGRERVGVYIPRRDTSSVLVRTAARALFPWEHSLAEFDVREGGNHFHVDMKSADATVEVRFDGRVARRPTPASVFASTEEAVQFFRAGSCGYSPHGGRLHGLELASADFPLEPLEIEGVSSSWFADAERFPEGSVELDSAFLMRGVEHAWQARGALSA